MSFEPNKPPFVAKSTEHLDPNWFPLLAAGQSVHSRAYAPYSGFRVAAVVQDETGALHAGVNVENCNYSESRCAERNAVGQMIAAGGTRIARVLLIVPTPQPCFPCGSCRQVLREFCSDAEIVAVNSDASCFSSALLLQLLPGAFDPSQLASLSRNHP